MSRNDNKKNKAFYSEYSQAGGDGMAVPVMFGDAQSVPQQSTDEYERSLKKYSYLLHSPANPRRPRSTEEKLRRLSIALKARPKSDPARYPYGTMGSSDDYSVAQLDLGFVKSVSHKSAESSDDEVSIAPLVLDPPQPLPYRYKIDGDDRQQSCLASVNWYRLFCLLTTLSVLGGIASAITLHVIHHHDILSNVTTTLNETLSPTPVETTFELSPLPTPHPTTLIPTAMPTPSPTPMPSCEVTDYGSVYALTGQYVHVVPSTSDVVWSECVNDDSDFVYVIRAQGDVAGQVNFEGPEGTTTFSNGIKTSSAVSVSEANSLMQQVQVNPNITEGKEVVLEACIQVDGKAENCQDLRELYSVARRSAGRSHRNFDTTAVTRNLAGEVTAAVGAGVIVGLITYTAIDYAVKSNWCSEKSCRYLKGGVMIATGMAVLAYNAVQCGAPSNAIDAASLMIALTIPMMSFVGANLVADKVSTSVGGFFRQSDECSDKGYTFAAPSATGQLITV